MHRVTPVQLGAGVFGARHDLTGGHGVAELLVRRHGELVLFERRLHVRRGFADDLGHRHRHRALREHHIDGLVVVDGGAGLRRDRDDLAFGHIERPLVRIGAMHDVGEPGAFERGERVGRGHDVVRHRRLLHALRDDDTDLLQVAAFAHMRVHEFGVGGDDVALRHGVAVRFGCLVRNAGGLQRLLVIGPRHTGDLARRVLLAVQRLDLRHLVVAARTGVIPPSPSRGTSQSQHRGGDGDADRPALARGHAMVHLGRRGIGVGGRGRCRRPWCVRRRSGRRGTRHRHGLCAVVQLRGGGSCLSLAAHWQHRCGVRCRRIRVEAVLQGLGRKSAHEGVETVEGLRGVGGAVVHVAVRQIRDEPRHLRVDPGADRGDRRHVLVHMLEHHRHGIVREERHLPGEHLPRHDADGIAVALRCGQIVLNHLGRKVGGGAEQHAG